MTRKLISIHIAFLLLCVTSQSAHAQKTIGGRQAQEREIASKHKVMLIPFEPRLYMGEIDRYLAMEGRLTARQIRHAFRDGLNDQLYKAFRAAQYGVVDLMEDTVKFRKDMAGIYQYLSYHYMHVPDQANYKPPVKEKKENAIEKGQLNVETSDENRFMNAKLTNAKVVPLLYGKYKTDLFVFVNQLDITEGGAGDAGLVYGSEPKRKITVHYTVYTLDAREINSGIAVEEFDPELNNQKKIIDKHFSKLAATIVQRVNKALLPPAR